MASPVGTRIVASLRAPTPRYRQALVIATAPLWRGGLSDGQPRRSAPSARQRPRRSGTPITITNKPGTSDMGTNTIVYLWGSAADGSLRAAVQNVRIDLQ